MQFKNCLGGSLLFVTHLPHWSMTCPAGRTLTLFNTFSSKTSLRLNFPIYFIELNRVDTGTGCELQVNTTQTVLRIRIHRIHMFLGLQDLDPDPLVRGMDPDPLVRGMDPRIRIRLHPKMSWIRNTGLKEIIFMEWEWVTVGTVHRWIVGLPKARPSPTSESRMPPPWSRSVNMWT